MLSFGITEPIRREVAAKVVGHRPLVAPPVVNREILLPNWNLADFIYIDLHGRPDYPSWLFGMGERILSADVVADCPKGKIVFATTCYLRDTDFYDILRAGNVLICGDDINWGSRERAIGASLLGLWVRRMLDKGTSPEAALLIAKIRVALSSLLRHSDADALQFYIAPPL